MKIDWNKDTKENGRYIITDACTSSYASEAQIRIDDESILGMEKAARLYAQSYDHNGTDEEFAVCEIEDLDDGETHRFAFDGRGNFEWDTDRQG